MDFCQDCDNMLYTKIITQDESTKLVYHCLNCNKYVDNNNSNSCIYELNFNLDNIRRESCINKYTTYDPTLPRAKGIKCPFAECPKKDQDDGEIVYINYDSKKLKYTYICLDCKNAGKEKYIW
jgi:DNA-directed RNA polymerase subunit M/transcription elongation factor TFIIS